MTVYIIYITVHTHTHTHIHNTHLRAHMHIHTHTQRNTLMLAPLSPCSPFKYALQLLNCQFKKNIKTAAGTSHRPQSVVRNLEDCRDHRCFCSRALTWEWQQAEWPDIQSPAQSPPSSQGPPSYGSTNFHWKTNGNPNAARSLIWGR